MCVWGGGGYSETFWIHSGGRHFGGQKMNFGILWVSENMNIYLFGFGYFGGYFFGQNLTICIGLI